MTGPGGRATLVAYFTATVVSALGSRVSMVAIPWLVLTTTANPVDMGLVIAAQMVPYLISSVFGTPLADRIGVRTSAILADVVSALAVATIAATPDTGLPVVLAMVAISGAVRGAGERANHVLLRPVVEAAGVRMVRVTALYNGVANGATFVGAPVGGLLIVWLGARQAVWFDAVSFAASALILATLVRPPVRQREDKPPREPYVVALRGGARQLAGDRLLVGVLAMAFFANMVNQANTAVFVPLWVSEVLGSPAALGTVLGAFAAGVVAGNLVFAVLAPKLPQYLTIIVGLALSGAPRLLVLGLSDSLALVLSVTFACGFAVSAVNPIFGAMLYERVPEDYQTRVFGLVMAVSYAGFPIGGLLGGVAVSLAGLTTALLAGCAVYLVATLVPLVRYAAGRAGETPETVVSPARDTG